jgi:hypothetical protein
MNACLNVWGPTALVIPARRADLADDPGSAVTVQPVAVRGQKDRSCAAFADGQVDRSRGARRQRDGDNLPALSGDHQGPVPALDAHGFDVRASGFGDP